MAVSNVLGWGWLAFLAGCLVGFVVRSVALDSPFAAKVDQRVCSKYAYLLNRLMEVRKYDASDWEPCVVVAVGRLGSVCVRRTCDLDRPGFWIHHDRATTHLREIEQ